MGSGETTVTNSSTNTSSAVHSSNASPAGGGAVVSSPTTPQKTQTVANEWFDSLYQEVMSEKTPHTLTKQKASIDEYERLEKEEAEFRKANETKEQDFRTDLEAPFKPKNKTLNTQHKQNQTNQQAREQFAQKESQVAKVATETNFKFHDSDDD